MEFTRESWITLFNNSENWGPGIIGCTGIRVFNFYVFQLPMANI